MFDLVAARTGLREHEAPPPPGYDARHDHLQPRRPQGLLPGRPAHHHPHHRRPHHRTHCSARNSSDTARAEIAKRVDTYATALFPTMTVDAISELDLSYTPPLGSPWDATQVAASSWVANTSC